MSWGSWSANSDDVICELDSTDVQRCEKSVPMYDGVKTSKCLPKSADDVVVISTICVNLPMGNGVKSDDVTLPSSNFVFFAVKLKKKIYVLRKPLGGVPLG